MPFSSTYYAICSPIIEGCKLYTNPSLTTTVPDGYYSDGAFVYRVSGSTGTVISRNACGTTTTTTINQSSISLGSPICKNNNCNDNGVCSIIYSINTVNAPIGSYITLVTTAPPSAASVAIADSDPLNGRLLYSEPNGSLPAVFFTLQLRNSGGVVIASSPASLQHQSFWQYIGNCPTEIT